MEVNSDLSHNNFVYRTAILVDGGFYRKRAFYFWGDKAPKERADELRVYCKKHIEQRKHEQRELYRIFYYDCPPIAKSVYHPFLKKTIDLSKSSMFEWSTKFYACLTAKRKFALRLGELDAERACFNIKNSTTKKLLSGAIKVTDLTEQDFELTNLQQKKVDMKIGIDIATLAYQKLVNQIILISGDSDFVPAAKLARIWGIDFILDSMKNPIKDSLFEHIDGIQTFAPREK